MLNWRHGISSLLNQPVFSISNQPTLLRDAVLAGVLSGEWQTLHEQVRLGIACEKWMDESEEDLSQGALDLKAREFRCERDLLTAESAKAWFEEWGMTPEEWQDYIHRSVARETFEKELNEIARRFPVSEAEIEKAIACEAVCGREIEFLSHELAARAAVYELMSEEAELSDATTTIPDSTRTLRTSWSATGKSWPDWISEGEVRESVNRLLHLDDVFQRFCARPAARLRFAIRLSFISLTGFASSARPPASQRTGPPARPLYACVEMDWICAPSLRWRMSKCAARSCFWMKSTKGYGPSFSVPGPVN